MHSQGMEKKAGAPPSAQVLIHAAGCRSLKRRPRILIRSLAIQREVKENRLSTHVFVKWRAEIRSTRKFLTCGKRITQLQKFSFENVTVHFFSDENHSLHRRAVVNQPEPVCEKRFLRRAGLPSSLRYSSMQERG